MPHSALAVAEYERLDQSSHGTLDLKLRLGKLYCAERNFAAAVAELRKARALYPRDETLARDLADAMSLAGTLRSGGHLDGWAREGAEEFTREPV